MSRMRGMPTLADRMTRLQTGLSASVRFAMSFQCGPGPSALRMRHFCFPEHVPESLRLVTHGIKQSHDLVMVTDRFHITSKQVFLLLTGWLKHRVAIC